MRASKVDMKPFPSVISFNNTLFASMSALSPFQENIMASCRRRSRYLEHEGSVDYAASSKRRIADPVFGMKQASVDGFSLNISQHIVELNNCGVAFYEKGDFVAADALFVEATSMRQQSLLNIASRYLQQQLLKSPAASGAEVDTTSSSKAKNEPPSSSYIYQRMDFDEGMGNVYTKAETLNSEGSHPAAVEATLLFNIAQAKRMHQDYVGAWAYYQQALEVLIPVVVAPATVGSSELLCPGLQKPAFAVVRTVHRIVIPVLHNIGLLAYRQGSLTEAAAFYELALIHGTAIIGSQSLCVGITLNCLGVIHYHGATSLNVTSREASAPTAALNCFTEALQILSVCLGPDAPAVATTLNNLGRVMVQQDDFKVALLYYERALKIRSERLGTDDIDYAATAFNAGQSLHQLGEYDRAIMLYKEFLRVASVKFSSNHRDVAVVLSGIAQIYQARKEYDQAQVMYEESLLVGRAALGNFHSEVAMLLNRVGNFYFEREVFDKALKAYKEGLRVERAVLDRSHPNVIVTVSNIGEIYRQKGDFNRAIKLYTEAMELQQIRYGDCSVEVAAALNVLGLIHDQKGESDLALKRLQEALVMRRTVLGDDHLDVSATLTYLGTLFCRRNLISDALQLFTESLRIRIGNYKESVACFKETLRVEVHVLGADHRDVSLTLYKLGEAHKMDGELDDALDSFQRALKIERRLLQEDPAAIAKTLNEIGNIHLAKGDVNQMMEAFVEAARMFRRAGLLVSSVSVSPVLRLYAVGFDSAAPAA